MTMKPLDTTFTSNGFVHEQIERTGNFAIYRRFAVGGGQEHFETIRIRSHNGFKIPWGTDGFTLLSIDLARAKLSTLLSDEQERASK